MFWKDPILWIWAKFEQKDICEFDKCPSCEEMSFLNWKCSSCWLGSGESFFNKLFKITEKVKQTSEDNNICSCWNKMWRKSIMCKECYQRNKVNKNF